jgi:hypothetical protein
VITLVESSRIPGRPESIWEFFLELDDHYSDWHPEHLRWKTMFGKPLAKGTTWFADEWVGPMRISARFFVEDSEPNHFFSFRIGFPSSLVRTRGEFRWTPVGEDECELVQTINIGFGIPLVGQVVDLALRLGLPFGEFRRHMREEQANMARIVGEGGWSGFRERHTAGSRAGAAPIG